MRLGRETGRLVQPISTGISALSFVTPAQRHAGQDQAILELFTLERDARPLLTNACQLFSRQQAVF